MAKRGAEALACPARFPSHFPRAPRPKRSRSGLEWREPRGAAQRGVAGEKRKRGPMEGGGGEGGTPGKRPADPPGSGPPKETGKGPEQRPLPSPDGEEAAAASGDPSTCPLAPARPHGEENEDDAWQYNSFQYWRSPLPAIDLCDILDLEKDDTVEAGDSNTVASSEMET